MKKSFSCLWKERGALQGKKRAQTGFPPVLSPYSRWVAAMSCCCNLFARDGGEISGSCHLPQAIEPQHCQPENLKSCGPGLSSAIPFLMIIELMLIALSNCFSMATVSLSDLRHPSLCWLCLLSSARSLRKLFCNMIVSAFIPLTSLYRLRTRRLDGSSPFVLGTEPGRELTL